MDRIETRLKEYDSLRAEILVSLSSRHSVLSFGLATIGVMLGASLAVAPGDGRAILVGIMLVLGVPLVAFFVLLLWLSEYRRAHRTGLWIAELEQKVNADFGERVLWWETHLRAEPVRRYPTNATVSFLLALSLFSTFIGGVNLGLSDWRLCIAVVILALAHMLAYRHAARSLRAMALEGERFYASLPDWAKRGG